MFKRIAKKCIAFVAVGLGFAAQSVHAAYDFVAVDNVTGEVTFTPGNLVTPVLLGLVGIVGAIGAVWVIRAGIGWMKRMIGG